MFTNISWATYSVFIIVTAGIYYLIVINLFYRKEIIGIVKHLLHFNNENGFEIIGEGNFDKEPSETIAGLESEIVSQLEEAKNRGFIKEEMMLSIELILQKYNSLKESPSLDSTNIYIQNACENICSIHLDKGEIERLWFR